MSIEDIRGDSGCPPTGATGADGGSACVSRPGRPPDAPPDMPSSSLNAGGVHSSCARSARCRFAPWRSLSEERPSVEEGETERELRMEEASTVLGCSPPLGCRCSGSAVVVCVC